jgi:hypothetical protein
MDVNQIPMSEGDREQAAMDMALRDLRPFDLADEDLFASLRAMGGVNGVAQIVMNMVIRCDAGTITWDGDTFWRSRAGSKSLESRLGFGAPEGWRSVTFKLDIPRRVDAFIRFRSGAPVVASRRKRNTVHSAKYPVTRPFDENAFKSWLSDQTKQALAIANGHYALIREIEILHPGEQASSMQRQTYAEVFEDIFSRRIDKLFDDVIAEHDPPEGRKAVFTAWDKWIAAAELPSRKILFIVKQPAKRAREIHFGSRFDEGKFSFATYRSPDGGKPEPEGFMAWLREQVSQSLGCNSN